MAAHAGIVLALELMPGQTADSIAPKQRLLTDGFIRDLYVIFQQRGDISRPVDPMVIKTRLLRIALGILGPDIVKDVLVEKLFEQPR